MSDYLTVAQDQGVLSISLRNDWVFANLNELRDSLEQVEPDAGTAVRFSCGNLREFDLAGAWILYERAMDFEEVGVDTDFEGFQAGHFKFLQHIIDIAAQKEYVPGFFDPEPSHHIRDGLRTLGRNTIEAVDSVGYIARAVLDLSLIHISEPTRH